MQSTYPTGTKNSKSKWEATGVYITEIEYFENFENFDNTSFQIEDYQDFMYSIIVYYYIKEKNGRRRLKDSKSVIMKKIKTDQIPELNYRNVQAEDTKKEFTITVVDSTSYMPNQPMLKLKYISNEGEVVREIEFIHPNPPDKTMKEYTWDAKAFYSAQFLFDLDNMK